VNVELEPEQLQKLEQALEEALETDGDEAELREIRRTLARAMRPDEPHAWYRLQ
jgi:hypothetical protein